MSTSTTMDKIEIQELTGRYALAMDRHDIEAWLKTWSPDGRWEGALGIYEGDRLPLLLRDLGERIVDRRHVVTNHVIDISGDQAEQYCYMQIIAFKGGPKIVATAVYRDRLKKIDGQWRFVHRQMTLDT